MEFKIAQKEIVRSFQRVQGFINLKGANPVLSNVRLEATKDGIEVFATDFDIGLSSSYPAEVVSEGAVALHGKMVFDIVRQLPDSEVLFRYSGSGRCEIDCGRSNFKLATIDPAEYPENPPFPTDEAIELDVEVFKDMLDKTIYATSQNESRMALNGVYCQFFPNSLKVVATDGHRLAHIGRNINFPIKETLSVIIPRKSVVELKKLLDEGEIEEPLHIVRADNRIFFKVGSLTYFSREVDGTYPNYDQVIPRSNTKEASINVEDTMMALRRVATVVSDKARLTNFSFKHNKLEISSDSSELGEAFEEIEIEYDGEPLRIGLNSVYTLETLQHIKSSNAKVKMSGKEDAVLIQPTDDDDYISVIMPMRI